MKYMTAKEIRESFLSYFESKGHKRVDSSSLVPYNDNTLLFTNAGMVQFKDIFLGLEKRDYTRATTSQRCVRAGGKHNDLDTVGRTARHHTFFEMLGNFSFGDYFKRDAIAFAWEFLTKVIELPVDRLYVTVYEKDDEAFQLWQDVAGVAPERIYRIGAKDNFWSMGETGPCGPCTEIFFDRGEKYTCDEPECAIGKCDCDRWMEIWNLVFMQYNRDESGTLTPLPNPCVDTGAGLERLSSVLQGKDSNYEIDIMFNIIQGVEKLCGKKYDAGMDGFPFRVIADHLRSCSFMIGDGIIPSNEGRGYVLRRILRRASRLGMVLGLTEPFLYQLYPYLKETLGDCYPMLIEQEESIVKVLRAEEERFHLTLRSGMAILNDIVAKMKEEGKTEISGTDLFMLYDTYGFPIDLSKDVADENGFTVDEAGFNAAMEEQRTKSASARAEAKDEDVMISLGQMLIDIPLSKFQGYESTSHEGKITAIVVNGEKVDQAGVGSSGWICLDETPFYAESGGQIGDIGQMTTAHAAAEIIDTQKLHNGLFVHKFELTSGSLAVGDTVSAVINTERRQNAARNHSATHLLHRALRMTLGEHVHQSGSYVTDDRLRFDFNSFDPLTAEQIQTIQAEVNEQILNNLPVVTDIMDVKEAKATGAMAFFGDKYGDVVRVVRMGDFSKELCGGTHVKSTGDIGQIKILGENGIGSGLRRIEALTGKGALAYYQEEEDRLNRMAGMLKARPENLEKRIEQLLKENKALAKELEKIQAEKDKESIDGIWNNAKDVNGTPVLTALVAAPDMPTLRNIMDMVRDKLAGAVIVLAAHQEDKCQLVVSVADAPREKGLHAGKLIKEIAALCGGNGGGRPDMAQAGGKEADPQKIKAALAEAETLISNQLA